MFYTADRQEMPPSYYGIHKFGCFRLVTSECDLDLQVGDRPPKLFIPNPRRFRVLTGRQYMIAGDLHFTPEDIPVNIVDKKYYSYFGPYFPHSSVVYGNNNQNAKMALRRMTCYREPAMEHLDDNLRHNQMLFIRAMAAPLITHLQIINTHLASESYEVISTIHEYAPLPHRRREDRIRALDGLNAGFVAHLTDHIYLKYVIAKVKTYEYNRLFKYPRLIGDFTTEGSLQGLKIVEQLKEVLANNPFTRRGHCGSFVKSPVYSRLLHAFTTIINPIETSFICFSDDSCYSWSVNGVVNYCNLDISSCDTSHTIHIFNLLAQIMPNFDAELVMHKLIDQCALPIGIHSTNRTQFVLLQPDEPVLYSGSVLTTYINTIASLLLYHAITRCYDVLRYDVIHAAQNAGYILTVEPCSNISQITFLKHFPYYTSDNELSCFLCLGVLLRSFGKCKGDLPGRSTMPMRERAGAFLSGLLQGLYPRSDCTITKILKEKFSHFPPSDYTPDSYLLQNINDDLAYHFCHDDVICDRYSITPGELEELHILLRHSDFGDQISCAAVIKIMNLDYGSGRHLEAITPEDGVILSPELLHPWRVW
jgi:hypothetical protein